VGNFLKVTNLFLNILFILNQALKNPTQNPPPTNTNTNTYQNPNTTQTTNTTPLVEPKNVIPQVTQNNNPPIPDNNNQVVQPQIISNSGTMHPVFMNNNYTIPGMMPGFQHNYGGTFYGSTLNNSANNALLNPGLTSSGGHLNPNTPLQPYYFHPNIPMNMMNNSNTNALNQSVPPMVPNNNVNQNIPNNAIIGPNNTLIGPNNTLMNPNVNPVLTNSGMQMNYFMANPQYGHIPMGNTATTLMNQNANNQTFPMIMQLPNPNIQPNQNTNNAILPQNQIHMNQMHILPNNINQSPNNINQTPNVNPNNNINNNN